MSITKIIQCNSNNPKIGTQKETIEPLKQKEKKYHAKQ